MITFYFICLSDYEHYIGDFDWYPAIMDTQEELDFVRSAQKGFLNYTSYWIGGSTNSGPFTNIYLSDYRTTNSGNNTKLLTKGVI